MVNGSTDEQRRQKCENIGLQEGDKQFQHAKQSGTENADSSNRCPHAGRGRGGCGDQAHNAQQHEVTSHHIGQTVARQESDA
jgi:hypothetical protein